MYYQTEAEAIKAACDATKDGGEAYVYHYRYGLDGEKCWSWMPAHERGSVQHMLIEDEDYTIKIVNGQASER